MDDYSLVPVDHQPDFDDVSLVPVDHDPFSADDVPQQAPSQQAQAQPAQPQPPAGIGQPNVGTPANNLPASEVGESWNPDAKNTDISGPNPSAASTLLPNNVPFKPFGELGPATFTPTQQIGNLAADAATALGMQPYTANDLANRIGNVLGLSPLGVAGSALDFIDATHRGDLPGAITAAAGMIPGGKGIAHSFSQAERGIIGEAKSIVTSPQMVDLAAAHGAGEPMTVNIGGRLVQYEPNLPASGMTAFGENGFLLGPNAFSSNLEHNQTVLHELHRLNFSNSAGGVFADLATQETKAAADFAARAGKHLP